MQLTEPRKALFLLLMFSPWLTPEGRADETCNSPYLSSLIHGQEDYLYVWTLGVKGVGDGFDKLVTLDVKPGSATYGKVIAQASVGERGEAHHVGFTDDRRFLWAGALDSNNIHIFDISADPSKPRLVRTITDLGAKSGLFGPHTFYALPGRMLVGTLSNAKDGSGVTGMALYNNQGTYLRKYDLPVSKGKGIGKGGDGYGYDLAINPSRNLMLTSSFTGRKNYMTSLATLINDSAAMKNFGNTMVMWNLKAMRPERVFDVPGAPLEIRWSLRQGDDWAITSTALTSKLWLVKKDANGAWQAKAVADIGDPAKTPLPVDISITADSQGLWVNTFMDGMTRYFDITNPEAPRQTYAKKTGSQVNMVSQSWDGKRVYVSSSLLAKWDKSGKDDEQFVKLYGWDGKELVEQFTVDFYKLQLGRAHHMKLGSRGRGAPL